MGSSIIFPNLHITLNNIEKGFYVGSFFIAFYGVIIAIGMLVGVTFILKEAVRVGFDEDKFLDVCIITIIVGVIGARLYYVLFAWDYYKDNLLSIFNIRQGGLAIYGGVLAGIACVAVLCRAGGHLLRAARGPARRGEDGRPRASRRGAGSRRQDGREVLPARMRLAAVALWRMARVRRVAGPLEGPA